MKLKVHLFHNPLFFSRSCVCLFIGDAVDSLGEVLTARVTLNARSESEVLCDRHVTSYSGSFVWSLTGSSPVSPAGPTLLTHGPHLTLFLHSFVHRVQHHLNRRDGPEVFLLVLEHDPVFVHHEQTAHYQPLARQRRVRFRLRVDVPVRLVHRAERVEKRQKE